MCIQQCGENVLGNNRSDNYFELVEEMLAAYRDLHCNMRIKLHFLFRHLHEFLENLGAVSDEQGERFRQDIKIMEERYQGRWDMNMMSDYCWSMEDCPIASHCRKPKKRSFLPSQ